MDRRYREAKARPVRRDRSPLSDKHARRLVRSSKRDIRHESATARERTMIVLVVTKTHSPRSLCNVAV